MKKRILSIVLAGLLLAGVFAACVPAERQPAAPTGQTPPTGTPTPPPRGTIERGLTVGIQLETGTIVPGRHSSMTAGHKNSLTHNGLFRPHYYDLSPVEDIVASWAAISDTIFEFTIHEGIMFHNGVEMTAYDVVASLEYVRQFPYARAAHGSVAGAEVVDRYTLRIDTGEPNAMLFFDLAHTGNMIMPGALIDEGFDFSINPIGSGPFVFHDWRFGDSLTFTRFDNYFDEERAAHLEYVVWRIIPEGSSRTIALETGEIDYIVEVPFPDIPRLEASPDITVFQRPGVRLEFMALNNDLPMFQNVYVRRAIDMAIDREAEVIASVDGWGIPIFESVPMVLPGASGEGSRSFDPEGARALLEEQGIDPSTITFEMLAFNEEGRRRGEVIQSNLADIGIHTTIGMMDLAAFLAITSTMDYEAAFSSFTSSNLMSYFLGLMHENSIDGQNRARMRNPELTSLIDQAIATIDAPARMAVLEEASRVANEHAGYIPLHLSIMVRAFNSNLVAPEISASGLMYLNMAFWAE